MHLLVRYLVLWRSQCFCILVIPTSTNLTRDINSKLLLPIGFNDPVVGYRPSTSKTLVEVEESEENNINLNVEPPEEEGEGEGDDEVDPAKEQAVMISFDKIFGAF